MIAQEILDVETWLKFQFQLEIFLLNSDIQSLQINILEKKPD